MQNILLERRRSCRLVRRIELWSLHQFSCLAGVVPAKMRSRICNVRVSTQLCRIRMAFSVGIGIGLGSNTDTSASLHGKSLKHQYYVHLCQYTSPIDGVDRSKLMSTLYISVSEQFLDKVLAIVKAAIYRYVVHVLIETVRNFAVSISWFTCTNSNIRQVRGA